MKVFAYWDAPHSMPAYLQLCMHTWRRHLGADVTIINNHTLHQWIPRDCLELSQVKDYPVREQKDAIEIATLALHGGIFIDVDTLCVAPPNALEQALDKSEVALYGFHLGVVAARPNSSFMQLWLACLQKVLQYTRPELQQSMGHGNWSLGNYSFEIARDLSLQKASPDCFNPSRWNNASRWLRKAQRKLFFDRRCGHLVHRLDPRQAGFILEQPRDGHTAETAYKNFWFGRQPADLAKLTANSELIGLHHSWTPEYYCGLSFSELAKDTTVLSRLLTRLESNAI